MRKDLLYLMTSAMVGMAAATENRHMSDVPPPPKRTCKDCYFYTGGKYCKQSEHHVNKWTPANRYINFKEK